MNIPIYRAKKIDSDEYVDGFLVQAENKGYCIITKPLWSDERYSWHSTDKRSFFQIIPSTLSVHFPDMLDSDGNKIFASLDEYMLKGASIVQNHNFDGDYMIQHAVYSEGCIYVIDKDGDKYNIYENSDKLKVIGIQE